MAIQQPQPWGEIESDDRFQQLTPEVKLQVLKNWTDEVTEYGNSFGGFIDEAPRNNFQSFVAKKNEEFSSLIPEGGSGFLRQALDIPVNVASGVISGLKGVSDIFGAGNPLSQELGTYQEFYQNSLSPEAVADQQKIAGIMAEAKDKGLLAQVGAGARAFAVAPLDTLAQAAGSMAPIIATGAAGEALGLGVKGVQVAQGALGASMGAGNIKGSIYQNTKDLLLQSGKNEAEAEAAAQEAQSYGGKNLDQILLGAGLGAADALTGVESILAGAATKGGGVISKAAIGGISEAIPEFTQGSQEQLAQNLAAQRVGLNVPTMQGVVAQGTMEGLAGFAAGAPVGLAEAITPNEATKIARDKQIVETLKVEENLLASSSPLTAEAVRQNTATSLNEKDAADRVASMVATIEEEAAATAPTEPAPTVTTTPPPTAEQKPPIEVAPVAAKVEVATQYQPESLQKLTDEQLKAEENTLRVLVTEAGKISQGSAATLQANLDNITSEIDRRNQAVPKPAEVTPAPTAPAVTTTPPAPAPTEVPPAPKPTEIPPAPAPTEVPPAPTPAPTEVPPAPTPAPTEVPPTPAPTEVPPAPTPAPTEVPPAPTPLAPELQAPNANAQAYEDELVNEALTAGTKVPQRTVEQIRKDLKGTGWYTGQYQAEIRKLRERVKTRIEAGAPKATTTAPAVALPAEQETLIQENLQKGGVPSTATIKSRLKDVGVEQHQAVRKESIRRLATNYGVGYSDTLDMVKDFEKKDSLPVRLVPTAEEGVSTVEAVFVNNPDVTARQLDKGYFLTVPENMRSRVALGITFDQNTGQVTSAQSRGFTVQKLGELAKQVRDSRVKVEGYADINSEADMAKVRAGVQKLSANKDFKPTLLGVVKRLAEFNTDLPVTDKSILETKALSIWVDGQLRNKPVDPAMAWKFAERKLAPKLAVRVQEESMQAAYTEGGKTLEDVLPSEEPTQDELDTEAEQEAAVAAAAAETGEVYKPEPDTGKVTTAARASRVSYDRAKTLVDNPKPPANLGKAAKVQFAQFLQEAKDLIESTKDIRAQLLKDGISAKEYGTWTYDDFANVDVGNTGVVLESSTRDESPYIREQIAWLDNIASQLGVPDAGFFTPEQFTAIAKYYADKYRSYFDSGNVTLPADSVVTDTENLQKLFEAGVGQASVYRAKLQELQESYPGIRKIVYSTKRLATAWYDPKYPGMVFFNPVQLEREIAGLTDSEAFPILRAVMDEEYDHYVTIGVISPQQAASIVEGLSDTTLNKVLDEYVPVDNFETPADRQAVIDELMRNPDSIGYEYLRMIRQRMKSGLTTEDLTNNIPQSVKDKIFQMLRALIAKLKTRLLVYKDPVLAHTVKAIQHGYRVMEIREEIRKLSPEDKEALYDNPIIYRELFSKPAQGAVEQKQVAVNNAAEAAKIRPGRSYWILPNGQVIDVVGVDFSNTNPTHGRYVRQWVKGNLRSQTVSIEEKEISKRIEDRARDLMALDIGFLEYDEASLEEEYQEAAAVQEALGEDPPDRDQFMLDAYNSAGPTDAAYNLAAIAEGWARVAVPRQMDENQPLTVQVSKEKLGRGANTTISELTQLRPTYVTNESTSAVGEYLGAKVTGYLGEQVAGAPAVTVPKRETISFLQYLRNLPNQAPYLPSAPGKRTRGTRTSDKVFRKGGVFSSGLFTPKQRDIILAGKSEVAAANNEFKFTLEALDRAVKKAYGNKPPTDVINRVLGSTENPLTDTQVQDLRDYAKTLRASNLSSDEVNEKVAARKAVFRNDNQNAQRAQIAADLATLDPKVAQTITAMRQKLDALSTKMIEGGYIAQGLIPVFEGNMELYLHRNYAIYNDPIWKEYMTNPQTAEHMKIRTEFEKLATDRAVAEKVADLRRESRKIDPTKVISVADAKKEIQNNYTEWVARRVDEITTDFLNVADEDSYKFFVNGTSIPGKRSLNILKVRGQLPKEVRDFWGEEKDIKLNFAHAAGKMASFISATDTARNLLDNGISEGFIWKKNYDNRVVFNGKTRKYDVILGDVRKEGFNTEAEAETWRQAEYPAAAPKLMSSVHPKGWVPLIKKGTNPQSIAPLDGAYGPPELRDALNQAFNPQATAGWANWFSALSLAAMSAKTIGYIPRSVMRNFLGNPLIVLSKGMFNLGDPMSMVKSMADGFKVAGLNVGLRGEKLLKVQPLLQKLVRLGVVGDTLSGGLLKKLYEDNNEIPIIKALYSDTSYDSKLKNLGAGVAKKVGKAYSVAADIYQGVDDIWKVYAWQQERMNQAKANPGMTDEQLDEAAAYVVRNTLPTYSLSPQITKELRRIPVLAPFITWTSEVLRTTSNGISIANSEIKEGLATKNKAMYANGISRWAGLIGALGIIPVAAAVSKAVFGNTDDDDEAVRNLVRDWQKNSEIMLLDKPKDGKVKYVDLSYLDPFQVFKEPVIAAMRGFNSGDDPMKVAYDTGREALRPVLSEQLLFGAVLDSMRNQTADGMRITNPQDTLAKQTYDKIMHVASILTPGVLADTIPNIMKGAEGKISSSGKVYSLSNELYSAVLGQKISEMDAQTSLRQKMGAYKRGNMDATSLFTNTLLNRGTIEPGDVVYAYENANRAKQNLFNEMKKAFDSAVQLGVSKQQAAAILMGQGTGEGLSKDIVREVISGQYVPYMPSNITLERVVTRPNGNERIAELRKYLIEKQRNKGGQ
jgi:hypothetical protein